MTKIALVTGASRGLGRNTALSIARHGGDVVLTYQSREEDAQAAVAEIAAMGRKAVAFQLDTGNVAGFTPFADRLRTALRETWQRETFDHLVNNAGRGIAVNTVAPGAIETDFGGGGVRDNPEVNKLFADMTALGRAGLPDDIGPMIASLLSEDNRWVNAQRIEVSGGQGI